MILINQYLNLYSSGFTANYKCNTTSVFTKGTMLPGTRVLGQLLKIHRNTAVAIYDELASQGWVEIIPNKGTFILEPDKKRQK